MSIPLSSIDSTATDPLVLAAIVIIIGFFGSRYWSRNSPVHFLIQVLVFAILTGLMLAGGVVPYRPIARCLITLSRTSTRASRSGSRPRSGGCSLCKNPAPQIPA